MKQLPDPDRSWSYCEGWHLTASADRFAKLLAHHEAFQMIRELPGKIVECGVWRGTSLMRWLAFCQLYHGAHTKALGPKIIAFDVFGHFPAADYPDDEAALAGLLGRAEEEGLTVSQLREVLERKGAQEIVEPVAGDICTTVPRYVAEHPELRIALLHLDTDLYAPAVTILEHLYPRLVPGGVLLIDDYGVFPGETDAVDAYFGGEQKIWKFPYSTTPAYVVKSS